MVKIDKCSKVIWKLPYRAHHSIYEDLKGNLWFPSDKKLKQPYRIANLIAIDEPEYIFQISPEGILLKEINILEVMINSGLLARLLPVRLGKRLAISGMLLPILTKWKFLRVRSTSCRDPRHEIW